MEIIEKTFGECLDKLLQYLYPLRELFWKELQNSTRELNDFNKGHTEAFCIYDKFMYLLGKYEDITLPDLKDEFLQNRVNIFYISELYVIPNERGKEVGKSMINIFLSEINIKNIPVVLGCPTFLEFYYNSLGFKRIKNYYGEASYLMVNPLGDSSIIPRFEKLFASNLLSVS